MHPIRLLFAWVALNAGSAHATDASKAIAAQPASGARVALPAFVDELTFESRFEDRSQKVVVTTAAGRARFDEPAEGYSFLYDPQTQFYTGLEHRNYTYWEFSWPEVRAAVENSKRGEKRLQDLANEGLNSDNPVPSTNAPALADTASLGQGDSSGYVWRPATERKGIAGLDCVRWTGETLSGENCEAWCYGAPLPRVANAIALLRTVNAPMALVPIRTVVPDFIFVVYDALLKSGVTPLMITWGSTSEKGLFRLTDLKARPYDAKLFTVPKLYIKTTLVTMDGMTDAQPAPALRGSPTPPRVDHLAPARPPGPGQ